VDGPESKGRESAKMDQRTEQRKVTGTPFPKGTSGNPGGRRAQLERAALEEAERNAVAAELTRDLGHVPDARERLLIASIASHDVAARKLERQGKSSAEPRRLMSRAIGLLYGREQRSRVPSRSRSPTPAEERLARMKAEQTAAGAAEAAGPLRRTADFANANPGPAVQPTRATAGQSLAGVRAVGVVTGTGPVSPSPLDRLLGEAGG